MKIKRPMLINIHSVTSHMCIATVSVKNESFFEMPIIDNRRQELDSY